MQPTDHMSMADESYFAADIDPDDLSGGWYDIFNFDSEGRLEEPEGLSPKGIEAASAAASFMMALYDSAVSTMRATEDQRFDTSDNGYIANEWDNFSSGGMGYMLDLIGIDPMDFVVDGMPNG